MVNLLFDKELQPYYEQFNMYQSQGMMFRTYEYQSGRKE